MLFSFIWEKKQFGELGKNTNTYYLFKVKCAGLQISTVI